MRSGLLSPLLVPALVLTLACGREIPTRIEDRNLGIVAVFPGQPRMHKFTEPTPFGEMEWFSTTYEPPGRLDRSFFIDVGNLPSGSRGGSTEAAVLSTLKGFLASKMGTVETRDVPGGFRYAVALPNGGHAEGLAIVKRGRIHRAQATVGRADDPQAKVFLDSFQVLP